MLNLDLSTEFGTRVARRLREERIIWLVTVRADLTPQPSPVWFYWDGETFLIYSQPDKQKLKNIADNQTVALHFDGDGHGGDIIIISGEAYIDEAAKPADQVEAYASKYQDGFVRIKTTAEGFATTYPIAIRVKPKRIHGH